MLVKSNYCNIRGDLSRLVSLHLSFSLSLSLAAVVQPHNFLSAKNDSEINALFRSTTNSLDLIKIDRSLFFLDEDYDSAPLY